MGAPARRLGTALLAVVALAATSCGNSDSTDPEGDAQATTSEAPVSDQDIASPVADETEACEAPDEPLTIRAVQSLSGPIAAAGGAMTLAMEAAVETIDEQGGVFGQPIDFEAVDDGGDPSNGVAVVQELLGDEDPPDAVIAGTIPALTSAMAPILAEAGMFTVQHGTDPTMNDTEAYPYVFSVSYLPSDWAANTADYFSEQGYESIAMITPDDTSGRASVEGLEPALEEAGISLTAVLVPPDAVDVTAQMEQATSGDPDALLLSGYGAATGPIIQARATLMPDVPTYGSQYFSANNLGQLAPPEAYEGMTLQAISFQVRGSAATQSEAYETFYDAVNEETGGEFPLALFTYVVGWNDVVVAAHAAQLACSTDPEEMKAALESATDEDLPLLLGPVDFSPDNHFPRYTEDQFSWIPFAPTEGGQLVPEG